MHQGPNELLQKGYRKYGEVFTVPVLNRNITFLIGTDVTPFFFKATDEEMSQQEVHVCQLLYHGSNGSVHCLMCNCGLQVYQFNVPTFGKGVVFDVDSKIRAEQFKFFASALQSSKLKSYIPLFAMESEVRIDHSLLLWLHLTKYNAFCQCSGSALFPLLVSHAQVYVASAGRLDINSYNL